MHPRGVFREANARACLTRCLNAQHFAGHVADRFLNAFLLRFPTFATNGCQRWPRRARADVLLNQVNLGRGHMDLGTTLKFQGEELFFPATNQLQTMEARNAMVAVHHIVARPKLHECITSGGSTHPLHATAHSESVQHLMLRNHRKWLITFPNESAVHVLAQRRQLCGTGMLTDQLTSARQFTFGIAAQGGGHPR